MCYHKYNANVIVPGPVTQEKKTQSHDWQKNDITLTECLNYIHAAFYV